MLTPPPLPRAYLPLARPAAQLEVELRDTAQPVPPEFPRNKGPALIYCGIILGGISFILLGLTPILMFLVYVRPLPHHPSSLSTFRCPSSPHLSLVRRPPPH